MSLSTWDLMRLLVSGEKGEDVLGAAWSMQQGPRPPSGARAVPRSSGLPSEGPGLEVRLWESAAGGSSASYLLPSDTRGAAAQGLCDAESEERLHLLSSVLAQRWCGVRDLIITIIHVTLTVIVTGIF